MYLHPYMRLTCVIMVTHLISSALTPMSHAYNIAMQLRPELLELAWEWDNDPAVHPVARSVMQFLLEVVYPLLDKYLTGGPLLISLPLL